MQTPWYNSEVWNHLSLENLIQELCIHLFHDVPLTLMNICYVLGSRPATVKVIITFKTHQDGGGNREQMTHTHRHAHTHAECVSA